ncbi:MAG: 30S ribosome-binding factor RbfA [Candidatus Sericytochromatia bacterium]
MANSIRIEKITSEIQKALSQILQFEVHDHRVREHFGSITLVEVARDLKHAKVFVSVFGTPEEEKDFMQGLASAKGFIRSELGRQVRLRAIPELHFKLDHSLAEGSRIISLLDDMKAKGQL